MEIPKKSVLIVTISKNGCVTTDYLTSLIGSLNVLREKGIASSLYFDIGKSGIDVPRSLAATILLETVHTHLMFIDDDMAWQPETIARMIELDLDIVGVPYRRKDTEISYAMRTEDGYQQDLQHPSVLDVHDIGTGLLLIKKEVFERLKDKTDSIFEYANKRTVWMFFRHQIVQDKIANPGGEMSYMSEDLFFCRLARENGFQIHAYVDAETAHTGSISFVGNYGKVVETITGESFRDSTPKAPLRLMGVVG